jgi:hypothetical protein
MYNHPWTVALLSLTHIWQDCQTEVESLEALTIEGITADDIVTLIEALEQITDVSFR